MKLYKISFETYESFYCFHISTKLVRFFSEIDTEERGGGGRERDETSETTKDQRGIREYGVSGGEGYSVGIGKMLFTQGRSELQKLCPYLHVVSLLRDQIPDRARNPDNSSFDPSPVGSSPVPAGPVCTGERVKTDESEEEGREKKEKKEYT